MVHSFFVPLNDFFDWVVLAIFVASCGIIVGVTELMLRARARASAAEAAQEAQAKLSAIVGSSTDAIISKDLDGTITTWNAGATQMFGYGAAEIVGQSITRLVPPALLEEERTILARLKTGERVEHYETSRVAKDGRVVAVSLSASPVHDIHGTIVGAATIIRDFTKRRSAERAMLAGKEALRQSQARLSFAADAARLTYVEIDLSKRFARPASNFARVMGYEPRTPIEGGDLDEGIASLLLHVAPDDRPRVEQSFRDFLSGAPGGTVQYRVIGDDGAERWIDGVWSAEFGADGKPTRGFVTNLDVTPLIEGRNALADAKVEAERASQDKSKFLATASHDLRQPVQSLVLLLALLERQIADSPQAAKTVATMKMAIAGLNGLLTGVLDISRLDAGVVSPITEIVDLDALVKRLWAEFAAKAADKGLECRLVTRRLQTRADPNLLERALRNLIENAVRYTAEGGILLGLRRRGDRVRIDVVDTGVGIPSDKQQEIFEEFHQLNNPGRNLSQGLGLGLAIVARLADLLGAEVAVSSKVGRGSRFSLSLPLADEAVGAVEAATEAPEAIGGRVLIVEDNEIVRVGLEAMLQEWGCSTLSCSSGEEAVELAAKVDGRLDMILADHRLGAGLTGVETIKEIERRAGHRFPALVLTGDTAKERIAEIVASGFEVMHKPVSADELRRKLSHLMGT